MSKAPSYLWKNRYGVFYLRIVLSPAVCYTHNYIREIKKSLRTRNRQEAIILARVMKVRLEETLGHEMKTRMSVQADEGINPQHIITMKKVQLGADRLIDEITIEADTPEQEAHIAQQLLSLPRRPPNLDLSPNLAEPEPSPLLSH